MGASSLVIYNVTKLELSFPLPTSLTCQTMSNDFFRLPHTPPYCQALGPDQDIGLSHVTILYI